MKIDFGFVLKCTVVLLLGFFFYLGAKYFVPYPDASDYLQIVMTGLFGGLAVWYAQKEWNKSDM